MFGWPKKKSQPNLPDRYTELQQDLRRILETHGVSTVAHENWLLPNGQLPAIRAGLGPVQPNDGVVLKQIDVELRLSAERSIVESYAGTGADDTAATNDALLTFCAGAFHVYLSAFWSRHESDQVDIQPLDVKGASWSAYIGNTIFKASAGQSYKLAPGYFDAVMQHIRSLPLISDHHWLSIYFYNLNDKMTFDCYVDNVTSADLNTALAALEWSPGAGFYSGRNFVLMKRIAEAPAAR